MPISKSTMNLKVITPKRVIYEDEVNEIVIDTLAGQITVLPNHAAMVTILKAGEAIVRKDAEEKPFVFAGGFLEVAKNKVVVLSDTAEHVAEIDLDRAQKAVELATRLLREKKFDVKEYESLQQNLAKNMARINGVRKWRG